MAQAHGPRIVTDGLVFCVDAANVKSYPGSGNTWSNLANTNSSGTFSGATYDNGSIDFVPNSFSASVSYKSTRRCGDFTVVKFTILRSWQ